jgi:hypothetical protein
MAAQEGVEDLKRLGLDEEEAEAVLPAQLAPARVPSPSRICTDFLTTEHPDTGLDVVFVPGEQLPEWAYAVQKARQAAPVGDTLPVAPKKSLKASQAAQKAE